VVILFLNIHRIRESFKLRSTQYGSNTVVVLLLVLGILGIVNYLGKKHHKRFDLTTAQVFSLSDQSNKVVRSLKGEVKILYFDKEPNSQLNDLMSEYKGVDPSKRIQDDRSLKEPARNMASLAQRDHGTENEWELKN
jgi:ABC-type uncharacterized transport system involved in gliding motility auxiliary subunit